MLAYVTLGSNDIPKALEFYDALLGELGAKRMFDNDRLYFYGVAPGQPMVAVGGPFDAQAATCGNGVMAALAAPDKETVDKIYAKAMELGASDEGEPGQRMPIFYGAYFRDLDGNKLCVCKLG
ncbi:MAG: VOC family protein [Hyphomonadaceae bacterium]|nr:VOC family protein [Hyphomonadaceae bacterium]